MINILHIIPNLRKGGAERLAIDIVTDLSKKKDVTVSLVVFENKMEYDVKDIEKLIHIIPSSIKLSLTKKNKYTIKELQEYIDEFQPNIIHSHLFEAEIVSRSCYYPKAKWFSHCHDNMIQFQNFDFQTITNKKYVTNFYEKIYLFKCYKKNGGTNYIAISNDTKKYFEKTGKPYKIDFVPNAINFQKFFNQNTKNINNEMIKFITVGSLADKKNQIFLIDVIAFIKNKGLNPSLEILGDGINKVKIENRINELGLKKIIILRGNVDNVEDYLKSSDIYLHSATYEPFGLVLLEAMAAGLPVITLDGKGNRDLIEQGQNGYMLFEQDSEKFADTIINLWNDKNKYQEMSSYAQQFAKKYDIKEYCVKLLDLYNKVYTE